MLFVKPAYAQITNPALRNFTSPDDAGAGLAFYIAQLWKTIVVIGGILFLLYLIWGGIDWLTAGGDKSKVEGAQKKISNALTGLAILVASFAIVTFVGEVLKIDLLNIDWSFGS